MKLRRKGDFYEKKPCKCNMYNTLHQWINNEMTFVCNSQISSVLCTTYMTDITDHTHNMRGNYHSVVYGHIYRLHSIVAIGPWWWWWGEGQHVDF